VTREEAEDVTDCVTVDESDLLARPAIKTAMGPIGKITIEFGWVPGADIYANKLNMIFGRASELYGARAESFSIKCGACYDLEKTDELFLTSDQMDQVPQGLIHYLASIEARFSKAPCPAVQVELPYNALVTMPLGTIVKLTSTTIPNPTTGTRGMVGAYCQVVEIVPQPMQASISATMWLIDAYTAKRHKIAPSAIVASYSATGGTGGRPRITCEANVFTEAGGEPYAYDTAAFNSGDKICALTYGYVRASEVARPTMEIYSVGTHALANTIDLTAAPTYAPMAGDIIETERYDLASVTQMDEWTFQADAADGFLGASNDDPNIRM
jgi:hypothetical protein